MNEKAGFLIGVVILVLEFAFTIAGYNHLGWGMACSLILWFLIFISLHWTYKTQFSNPRITNEVENLETIPKDEYVLLLQSYNTLRDDYNKLLHSGIHLRGWWCQRVIDSKKMPGTKVSCDTFNGEEKETKLYCDYCGKEKQLI